MKNYIGFQHGRKNIRKNYKIKNFSQENQKIKLPTNKLTETRLVLLKFSFFFS